MMTDPGKQMNDANLASIKSPRPWRCAFHRSKRRERLDLNATRSPIECVSNVTTYFSHVRLILFTESTVQPHAVEL
jgi:hypothetical protein